MHSRVTSSDKETLFDAARNGRLKEFIELSCKFSNCVKVLSRALREACLYGHMDVVKWLIEHTTADVNYNSTDVHWWSTPLTAACFSNHLDVVKYLVKAGYADVNLHNCEGDTPLTVACNCVHPSVIIYLLSVGDLDFNMVNKYNGNSALHFAVWCSKEDDSQLHWACDYGDVTRVRKLVFVSGIKINVQNNSGNTPLHRACFHGNSDMVETLMLAGADETITNDDGETPGQVAEGRKHSKLLKLLDRNSLWQMMLLWDGEEV